MGKHSFLQVGNDSGIAPFMVIGWLIPRASGRVRTTVLSGLSTYPVDDGAEADYKAGIYFGQLSTPSCISVILWYGGVPG